MRVTESIAELRRICHYSREADGTYRMSWWDREIAGVAVYLTKLFLEMGLSANQVSFIGLVITVIGGAFLVFPSPGYWLIGIALLGLYQILGHVDGGVARYNKTASTKGAFWNAIPEQFVWLYTPICISFGIYNTVHRIDPFIIGFLAVLSLSLSSFVILVAYPILRGKGLLAEALATGKAANSDEHISTIIKYGRLLFGNFMNLFLWLLIATIVDCLVSPFTVGALVFNARYICFIMYSMVWLVGAIWNISISLRSGLRLRL